MPTPSSQAAAVLGSHTYNDVTLQLVTLREKTEGTAVSVPPSPVRSDAPEKKAARQLTTEEGVVLDEFLSSTSSQLTQYGIEQLQNTMKEGDLAVLFRNNHFSTICKREGRVYSLVTDIGYEKEGDVVWELLSVDGNTQFFSSEFRSNEDVKRRVEIKKTALEFGFSEKTVDDAIKSCLASKKELTAETVLQWLNENGTLP